MKRLKWLATILGTIAVSILPAVAVSAANPLTVTMVNTPQFTNGISSFTVTYVSDTEMDLSWVLDPNYPSTSQNIMIRAKYGAYPADIPNDVTAPSDGYLVYYGDGFGVTSAVDTSMDFNENAGSLYYKAWAQKADGTWYVTTHTVSKESRVVLFIGMIFLVFGLTIASFTLKGIIAPILRLASAILWIIMIPIMLSQNWTTTNTYLPTAISYFCIIMCIVMVIMTVIYVVDWRTSRRTHEPTDEEYQASYARQVRSLTKKKDRWG